MKNQQSTHWNDWNEWNEHTERLDAQHDAQQAAEKAAAEATTISVDIEKIVEARAADKARRREARREKLERREKREKRARRKARHEEREARRAENERREQEQAVARTARSLAAMENEKREREDTESETKENDTGSDNGMCGLQKASPADIDHRQTQAYFRSRTSSHTSPFRKPSQFHQHPQQWQPSVYNQPSEYDQPFHGSSMQYDHYRQSYPEYNQPPVYGQPFQSPNTQCHPPSHYHHQPVCYQPTDFEDHPPYHYHRQTTEPQYYPNLYRSRHGFSYISPVQLPTPTPVSQTITQQQSTATSTTIAYESHLTNPAKATTSNQSYPYSNIANSKAAPSILDSRGEVDNTGNAQLVVDTSADTAQAEEEETVDLDVALPDAEDSAVADDTTVVEHMAVVEDMAETEFNTYIGSEDTPTHINTEQTTTIAAPSVAVSFPNVKTRGEMIHPVDTVHLTKDGGCNAFDHTDCTDMTPADCQVDTANLTKDATDSFPNVKNRGEMIPLDTVLLTKDGGSEDHNCPADEYKEPYDLLAKDMGRDIDLHADELVRLQISQLDSDSIDNYIDHPGCTDTTLAFFTDTGASEAGESIDTCLGTTEFDFKYEFEKPQLEFDFKYEFEEPQFEFESYMKSSFDNIDPELSLTAPDAFHAYEFDFDPHILTTGPEAFRAYAHSLDETIYYTAHVRAGVT